MSRLRGRQAGPYSVRVYLPIGLYAKLVDRAKREGRTSLSELVRSDLARLYGVTLPLSYDRQADAAATLDVAGGPAGAGGDQPEVADGLES